MRLIETSIAGAYVIELEPIRDGRGFFARTWCARVAEEHGLNARLVQCNISFNHSQGTLRGMHYQAAPHEEVKVVHCNRGAIYDVIVDLRPDSPTFKRWVGIELNEQNRRSLYIPTGLAHGFQTLVDCSEVLYQMSEFFYADSSRGVRWNDPAFDITWPNPKPILSDRDNSFPDFGKPQA